MSKITEITRSFLRDARQELETELEDFSKKYGLTIAVGSAIYTKGHAEFKVQLATTSHDGTVNTREAEDFKLNADQYGLKPEHLNAEITYGGKRYRLVGLSPKSTKFPLLAERIPDGKRFKMPLHAASSLKGNNHGDNSLT